MRETANRRHSVLNVANNWIAISNRRKVSVYRTRRVWFGSIRCVRSLIIPFQNSCRTKPLNSINLSAFARKSWAMSIYLNFFWRSKRNNFSLWIFLLIQSSRLMIHGRWNFSQNYESFFLMARHYPTARRFCLPQSSCRARRASRWAISPGRRYNVTSWYSRFVFFCKDNSKKGPWINIWLDNTL